MEKLTSVHKKEWNQFDMDFMIELLNLHNKVYLKEKTQEDFNNLVIKNKDKIDNPNYLQVFSENVMVFNIGFYRDNFDMCKIFYDFMVNNPEWVDLDFGLGTLLRLQVFQDTFTEFLES